MTAGFYAGDSEGVYKRCWCSYGLLSDNAKVEIQEKMQEWLRNYHVVHTLVEQRIGEITCTANLLMDKTGTPE